jgi:hypothetical protein
MKWRSVQIAVAVTCVLGLRVAAPDALSAQCARCVGTPWPGTNYCEWGPFSGGGASYCEPVYPSGCVTSGSCGETFIPLAPDGTGRGRAVGGRTTSTVLAMGGGVQITRGCGGIILRVVFTTERARALRRESKIVVV